MHLIPFTRAISHDPYREDTKKGRNPVTWTEWKYIYGLLHPQILKKGVLRFLLDGVFLHCNHLIKR